MTLIACDGKSMVADAAVTDGSCRVITYIPKLTQVGEVRAGSITTFLSTGSAGALSDCRKWVRRISKHFTDRKEVDPHYYESSQLHEFVEGYEDFPENFVSLVWYVKATIENGVLRVICSDVFEITDSVINEVDAPYAVGIEDAAAMAIGMMRCGRHAVDTLDEVSSYYPLLVGSNTLELAVEEGTVYLLSNFSTPKIPFKRISLKR